MAKRISNTANATANTNLEVKVASALPLKIKLDHLKTFQPLTENQKLQLILHPKQ